MFHSVNGGACDTRKNALMQRECLPREISVSRRVFVSAFSRVQRKLARRAVLLTEPEKAGSPGRSDRGAHSVIESWAAFNVTRRLLESSSLLCGYMCARVATTSAIKK